KPAAFGIMFYDTENNFLRPVVYVRDVETIFEEGSCASGTVATAIALIKVLETNRPAEVDIGDIKISHLGNQSNYEFSIAEPEGSLICSLTKVNGDIVSATIDGKVEVLSELDIII
ncbi:MAG: hypothetical protein ACRCUS_09020, partial [Anaerovoracaceae bacterium]